MDRGEMAAEIVEIFMDVMDLDDAEITDATTADDVEEWDSLSHVRFIVAIEKRFGIKFTNAEIESLAVFGDVVTLAERKAAAA